MKPSIKLKRSTALDIATKRTKRWVRLDPYRDEIEHLFDIYWGGKERRISLLTIKIMAVNAIALMSIIFGLIYLIQYQDKFIASHLKNFETEAFVISSLLSTFDEGEKDSTNTILYDKQVKPMLERLSFALDKRIIFFKSNGNMLIDTNDHVLSMKSDPVYKIINQKKKSLKSVEILKDILYFIISWLPMKNELEIFPGAYDDNKNAYSFLQSVSEDELLIHVWRDVDYNYVLTASIPVFSNQNVSGYILLVSNAEDILEAMYESWLDVFYIFLITLVIIIFVSIYLSGTIAKPLKLLASATENVRKGKLSAVEIPDLSERNDEIGELSVVLKEMTNALLARMDAIESFASDVAHEIKNPLTSMKSAVETAEKVKKKSDRDKLLNIIRHDIDRLDRLITDISNASRLDAELSRENFENINLVQFLYDVVEIYKNPIDRAATKEIPDFGTNSADINDIHIVYKADEALHNVYGNRLRLTQVMENIISNALSFSKAGGCVYISLEKQTKRSVILVEDQGPGIPEKKLKNVFDRFYSERPSGEDYGKHSGLGLAICKQIIGIHNGLIYAENIYDKKNQITGARFVIILNEA